MKDLIPITFFFTLAYGTIMSIKAIVDYKLKKRLIDKAEANESFSSALSESMKSLSSAKEENKYPALKWGLICLFAGIGLIVINFLEYERRSPLPAGVVLAFTAIGFLIYYFVVKNDSNKSLEE